MLVAEWLLSKTTGGRLANTISDVPWRCGTAHYGRRSYHWGPIIDSGLLLPMLRATRCLVVKVATFCDEMRLLDVWKLAFRSCPLHRLRFLDIPQKGIHESLRFINVDSESCNVISVGLRLLRRTRASSTMHRHATRYEMPENSCGYRYSCDE